MTKMPVVFIGHGSPMNAIEDNRYTRTWRALGERFPMPTAILSVSAHWFTQGTRIMDKENPRTVYDMYGFPKELYEITYNSPGSPSFAKSTRELISRETVFDNSWGIDHGTWSVLVHMYPERNIPVFQVSIDAEAPSETHYQIGHELRALREQGVLILGSGNIVHNLRRVDWGMVGKGFDWAQEFDGWINEKIMKGDHQQILRFREKGDIARLAVPTPDHFYPLLYTLGASDEKDTVTVYNQSCELGSLSMTAYVWE